MKIPNILIVEDNQHDILLIKQAFQILELQVNFTIATNGSKALRCFEEFSSGFDLVFLDLNLPMVNGFDVLSGIRKNKELESLPVVVLTTSQYDTDIYLAYELKANAFLHKTSEFLDFVQIVKSVYNFWISPNIFQPEGVLE